MQIVLGHLRKAVLLQGGAGLSDGQLLDRFANGQDEAAFEALVRRHGPMVLGVCRRVLRDAHDAEDAFQATFLVLVRKARSIYPRDRVASWLYGVASRTALKARFLNAQRRAKESRARGKSWVEPVCDTAAEALFPVLDRELSRLPDKFRAPLVLCDLEGKSRTEAARQLGWPVGTLSWRLDAARKVLARRLTRQGLTLSAGAVAAVLTESVVSAGVATSLLTSTTGAAMLVAAGSAGAGGVIPGPVAALTEGVLHAMFMTKLKAVSAVMAGVAVIGLSTGGWAYQTRAGATDAGATGKANPGLVAQQPVPERAPQDDPAGRGRARRNRDEPDRDEAKQREQVLRQELEAVRKMAEAAKAEAEKQRQQAEEARRRAEEVVRQLTAQLTQARTPDGEGRRRNPGGRDTPAQPAQEGGDNRPRGRSPENQADAGPTPIDRRKGALDQSFNERRRDLMAKMQAMEEQWQRQRQEMQKLLQTLEEQHQRDMATLDRQREDMGGRQPNRGQSRLPGRSGSDGDRLERVLERLERLEQRLDRMEKGQGGSRQ